MKNPVMTIYSGDNMVDMGSSCLRIKKFSSNIRGPVVVPGNMPGNRTLSAKVICRSKQRFQEVLEF